MVQLRTPPKHNTPSSARSAATDGFALRSAIFLFGFLLHVNIHLPAALHVRFATDFIVLIAVGFSALLCFSKIKTQTAFLYYGTLFLILITALFLQFDRQEGENYNKIVTIAYMAFSLWLLQTFLRANVFSAFCFGVFFGYVTSVLILIVDASAALPLSNFGLTPAFDPEQARQDLIEGIPNALMLRLDKAGGVWTHGNEAGPVLALAAAAAAWLTKRYNAPRYFQVFLLLYLASFAFTLNRSGLIAVIIIAILMAPNLIKGGAGIIKIFGALLLVTCAGLVAYQFGVLDPLIAAMQRKIFDDDAIASNYGDRFSTTIAGLDLLFLHPFGIGTGARMLALFNLSGFRTPHNGFIAAGYDMGLVASVLLGVSTIYVMIKDRKNIFIFYSAIIFTVCLFFEELLLNPVYMLTAGLIIARATWLLSGEDEPRSVQPPQRLVNPRPIPAASNVPRPPNGRPRQIVHRAGDDPTAK